MKLFLDVDGAVLLCGSLEAAEIKLIDFGSACMDCRIVYTYIQVLNTPDGKGSSTVCPYMQRVVEGCSLVRRKRNLPNLFF